MNLEAQSEPAALGNRIIVDCHELRVEMAKHGLDKKGRVVVYVRADTFQQLRRHPNLMPIMEQRARADYSIGGFPLLVVAVASHPPVSILWRPNP